MAFWTRHKFALPKIDDEGLDVFDKVEATVELPGVPVGTKGKVVLVNGFEWPRYHVLFDNGESVANLDGRHVARRARR
jgi:hypothetical protein